MPRFPLPFRPYLRICLFASLWLGQVATYAQDPAVHFPDWAGYQAAREALVVLQDRARWLPLDQLEARTVYVADLSQAPAAAALATRVASYTRVIQLPGLPARLDGPRPTLIVSLRATGLSAPQVTALQALARETDLILVLLDSPESLATAGALAAFDCLILAGSATPAAADLAAQVILGGAASPGRLRAPYGPWPRYAGVDLPAPSRLGFAPPEAVGWDSQRLIPALEALVQEGLDSLAYPGCQLLVARHGQVVLHRAYGHFTYDAQRPVQLDDRYDFASMTKITGPLPGLMYLQDRGLFDPDWPLVRIAPYLRGSNKADLPLRAVLAHQARLQPYIAHQTKVLRRNGRFRWRTLQADSSDRYPVRIAPGLYLHRRYRDVILRRIRRSPLLRESGYRYAGLSFFLYPDYIARTTGLPYETWTQAHIYQPLGAWSLGYNPWQGDSLGHMAPTEYDSTFRRQLVQGYVHDEAAAMFGGVSGNAGLFGTALDLAKLMQCYQQGGRYGPVQLIEASTLAEWTAYQFAGNRRGLGFDKPPLPGQGRSYMAAAASPASFGHTGFTGTFAWADPETGILLVWMTNRVYPSRQQQQLHDLDLRARIHACLYPQVRP